MRECLYNRVHSELKSLLDHFPPPGPDTLITEKNVATRRPFGKQMAMENLKKMAEADHDLFRDIEVRETCFPGPENAPEVRVLIMRPKKEVGLLPGYLSIHGGGLILGSPEEEQAVAMAFCREVNCVVISPDYRLAPENPYPAGVQDCYAVLCHMARHAEELGIDPEKIGVGGGSAGGNLSAAMTLMARDKGFPKLCGVFLGSPMLDCRNITRSSLELDDLALLWNRPQNIEAWNMYLQGQEPDSYASPALAPMVAALPPAVMFTSELDPFRDESILYATRLLQQGISVDLHVYPGAYHGFDMLAPDCSMTIHQHQAMYDGMKRLLHKGHF